MYLVVLYIFIRWKGRVTIIVTITFLRIIASNIDQSIYSPEFTKEEMDNRIKEM